MSKRTQLLERKRLAYQHTFCGDGEVVHKPGRLVLADLKTFCHINRGGLVVSPVQRMTDPYATVYRAGLRDAYLRIALMLGLSESDDLKEDDDASQTISSEP